MYIYPFGCIYHSSIVTELEHAQHRRQDCIGQKERESLQIKQNHISHIRKQKLFLLRNSIG